LTVGVGSTAETADRGVDSSLPPANSLEDLCSSLEAKDRDGGLIPNGDTTAGKVFTFTLHTQTDKILEKKKEFSEKDKFGVEKEGELRDIDVFFTCKKGKKPEAANQDSCVVVAQKGRWSLFGVFDGHGPDGHYVSDYAVKVLVKEFFNHEDYPYCLEKTEEAFETAFKKCQEALHEIAKLPPNPKPPFAPGASGCTCTMALHLVEKDVLIIAHAGDSRGVLYVDGKPHYSTEDHKPNLPAEKKRIESKGGRVVFDGYYNYRVFASRGNYPGLNMSRALGDTRAHDEAGLSAEPELKRIDLAELRDKGARDLTLLICTDGVWEFITEEVAKASRFAKNEDHRFLNGQKDAEALAKESYDAWMKDSDNEISDDITVLVANLSQPKI
jgi:serine/threonine protein phosphatase PrpC